MHDESRKSRPDVASNFEQLYRRRFDSVSKELRRYGVPRFLLNDETHEFFLDLYKWMRNRRRRAVREEDLQNRLNRYLKNLDHKRFAPLERREWQSLDGAGPAGAGGKEENPRDLEVQILDRDLLVRYLRCMTPRSRLAVISYYLIEHTRQELASGWGISANTVATQAFRGIRQAREQCSELGPAASPPRGEVQFSLRCLWGRMPVELPESYARRLLALERRGAGTPMLKLRSRPRPAPAKSRKRKRSRKWPRKGKLEAS